MGESVLAEITLPPRIDKCDAEKNYHFHPNVKRDDDCLRSKRFQSSYGGKVGARVSFPLIALVPTFSMNSRETVAMQVTMMMAAITWLWSIST